MERAAGGGVIVAAGGGLRGVCLGMGLGRSEAFAGPRKGGSETRPYRNGPAPVHVWPDWIPAFAGMTEGFSSRSDEEWIPAPYQVRGRLFAGMTEGGTSRSAIAWTPAFEGPCTARHRRPPMPWVPLTLTLSHQGRGDPTQSSGSTGAVRQGTTFAGMTEGFSSRSDEEWIPTPYRVQGRLFAGMTEGRTSRSAIAWTPAFEGPCTARHRRPPLPWVPLTLTLSHQGRGDRTRPPGSTRPVTPRSPFDGIVRGCSSARDRSWIPAFAGMTESGGSLSVRAQMPAFGKLCATGRLPMPVRRMPLSPVSGTGQALALSLPGRGDQTRSPLYPW